MIMMNYARLCTNSCGSSTRRLRPNATIRSLLFSGLVSLLLTATAGAETLVVGGTGWSIGMARQMAAAYMKDHPDTRIEVPDSVGSGGGIKAVLAERFDFSFATRPIKKKNQGKGLTATPFVKTPFVLAVSPIAGKKPAMTSADILAAYSGELTTWPNGTRINHVLRTERETDTQMLIAHFEGIEPLLAKKRNVRGALFAYTDQEAMDIGKKFPASSSPRPCWPYIPKTGPSSLLPLTGSSPRWPTSPRALGRWPPPCTWFRDRNRVPPPARLSRSCFPIRRPGCSAR